MSLSHPRTALFVSTIATLVAAPQQARAGDDAPPAPQALFVGAAEPAPDAGDVASPRPEVVRTRTARIDRAALDASLPGPGDADTGHHLTLNLFDDKSLTVVVDAACDPVPEEPDSVAFEGHIDGREHSYVFVTRVRDAVAIDVFMPGGEVYEVRRSGGAPEAQGLYAVRQLDRTRLSPCGTGPAEVVGDPAEIWANPEAASRNQGAAIGPVIDVLVVYTPNARGSFGGTAAAAEAAINNWFSFANSAYRRCSIPQRVRMVRIQETAYTESAAAGTDLARLAGTGDGFMDEVHAVRNTYGADLVHLVSNSSGVCGIAYIMLNVNTGFASSAFGLTLPSCGAATFAHECGHNMGCAHDHDNGTSGAYCYSFGYRTPPPIVNRTIMAYEPGIEIPYFSTPDIVFQGSPIGIGGCSATAADNASTLRNTAATVAAFRATVVPNPAPDNFTATNPLNGAMNVPISLNLAWGSAANALEYNVYLSTNSDVSDPFFVRKGLTTTAVTVPAGMLANATQYYWSIEALGLGTRTISTPNVLTFGTRRIGDLNGDGVVGSTDLGILLGSWGPCPAPPAACPADLNGDGQVNAGDLAALLGAWG